MGRMDGMVSLVSGGAGGIGAATCRLLAAEGSAVVIGDLVQDEGERIAAAIRDNGGSASFVRLDVTDEASWSGIVREAEAHHGRLDVLVNNAGITDTRGLADTTAESWERMVAIDQLGVMLGMKHAAEAMRRSGAGSIVNVSSIAGLIAIPGSSLAYTATKGAVRLMTKFAAVELAGDNIRVNSVHPGRVVTEMVADQSAEKMEYMLSRTPLGRDATPMDIAYGILYLASREAGHVTGAELVIDGGFTAQ